MQAKTTCLIVLASVTATTFAVFNAFYQKRQFYPAVVFLTKSNASLAVLYAQAFVLVYLLAQLARKLLFGHLRASESEHVTERAWYAVTETCLAFTVFRDDFSPKFVAQFLLLLVLKCFHWLAEDRVDVMERSPVITVLFHARLMTVLGVLALFDSYFVSHAYFTTLLRGASVQIVFGFEYAILMTIVFYVALKYVLHSLDSRNVHPWENKAIYILYADLVVNFIRVTLYATFVAIMMRLHTFPLFSVRPMYLTLKAAKKAFLDIALSRRAVNYLNNLYPNATPDELTNLNDATCIICREEMTSGQAKKLPCNHIFHTSCLRSWFQRQQTCPTCRLDIIRATVVPPTPAGQAPPPVVAPAAPFLPQFAGFFPPAAAPPPPPQTAGAVPPPPASLGFPPMPFAFVPPSVGGFQPSAAMPFVLPFPAPPSFSALTDEEVRRMEDDSRRGVEARILALRNVQTLLDAAVIQLQQYLTIVPTLAQPTASTFPPAAPAPSPTNDDDQQQPSTSGSSSNFVKFELDPQLARDDVPSSSAAVTNGHLEEVKRDSSPSPQVVSTPTTPGTSEDVRQKRLEHFSKRLK